MLEKSASWCWWLTLLEWLFLYLFYNIRFVDKWPMKGKKVQQTLETLWWNSETGTSFCFVFIFYRCTYKEESLTLFYRCNIKKVGLANGVGRTSLAYSSARPSVLVGLSYNKRVIRTCQRLQINSPNWLDLKNNPLEERKDIQWTTSTATFWNKYISKNKHFSEKKIVGIILQIKYH